MRIFLSYASEDHLAVSNLHRQLEDAQLDPWMDRVDLRPGNEWQAEIHRKIEECEFFIPCLSPHSVDKAGFFFWELRFALVQFARRPPRKVYIVPVRLAPCEIPALAIPELGVYFKDIQFVDLSAPGGLDALLETLRGQAARSAPPPQPPIRRLDPEEWDDLETAARNFSATAGLAAMGFYRRALHSSEPTTTGKNPSTQADLNATYSVLESMHSVDSLVARLDLQYRVFAEELDDARLHGTLLSKLDGNPVWRRIKRSAADFRRGWENSVSFLLDAIDGTTNFDADLPLFCSASAVFLQGRLCVGAIYDPKHQQMFYGSLRHLPDGSVVPVACSWNVGTGAVETLRDLPQLPPGRAILGAHLPRSDLGSRSRMLRLLDAVPSDSELPVGTCMLNSGQLALAHVASGHLAAFVNNTTGIWDVAAGEVLVRAVGGKVTDFLGRDIDYGISSRTSVIAARDPEMHSRLLRLIQRHYLWPEQKATLPDSEQTTFWLARDA